MTTPTHETILGVYSSAGLDGLRVYISLFRRCEARGGHDQWAPLIPLSVADELGLGVEAVKRILSRLNHHYIKRDLPKKGFPRVRVLLGRETDRPYGLDWAKGPKDVDRAVAIFTLRDEGLTFAEIGKRFHRHRKTIEDLCKSHRWWWDEYKKARASHEAIATGWIR